MVRKGMSVMVLTIIVAACSLLYEFVLMYASTILLGEAIFYNTIIIGIYLCSLGIGALFAEKIASKKNILAYVELILSIVGSLSVLIIFWVASTSIKLRIIWSQHLYDMSIGSLFQNIASSPLSLTQLFLVSSIPTMFLVIFFAVFIGILSGIELPLLMKMGKQKGMKKEVSRVLFADYIGSFIASIIFPFFLLPKLTIFQISFIVGGINLCAALYLFSKHHSKKALVLVSIIGLMIIFLFIFEPQLREEIDKQMYYHGDGTVILESEQTKYQKISLVQSEDGYKTSLYLNSYLQFTYLSDNSSKKTMFSDLVKIDAHHEVLVHTPLTLSKQKDVVVILGGGDGGGLRLWL